MLQSFSQAFAATANYAYLLDKDGHLIACNHNLLHALKLEKISTTAVGAIYQLFLENNFGNPEQLKLLKKTDIDCLMSSQPLKSPEPEPLWLHKEKTHWFEIHRTPLLDKKNAPLGLMVELVDVSDMLHLHEQLEKISAELKRSNAKAGGSIPIQSDKERHEIQFFESPKVLLIEDDELAQKAAKTAMLHCNFEVDTAKDEKEFEKKFKPGKYQIVFMDIGLGNTSGYMIAKQLRQKEQGTQHNVPIIAVTGFDPENLRHDCAYYQMEGAIQKPLSIEQVNQINQRYIRHIDIEISGLKTSKPDF